MEQREIKQCFIARKNVFMIRELEMAIDEAGFIQSRVRKKCSEAGLCDQNNIMCKWVSMDFHSDGMDQRGSPPLEANPQDN